MLVIRLLQCCFGPDLAGVHTEFWTNNCLYGTPLNIISSFQIRQNLSYICDPPLTPLFALMPLTAALTVACEQARFSIKQYLHSSYASRDFVKCTETTQQEMAKMKGSLEACSTVVALAIEG